MTLSREARIILAILVVAVAAFVWVNYYNRSGQFGPVLPAPQSRSLPQVAVPGPAASATNPAAPADTAEAPAVAAPLTAPSLARDIEIAELPFLVTSPPAAETTAPAGEADQASAEAPPAPTRRVSINPFSPIIVQRASAPPRERAPEIRVVDVPAGPPAQASALAPVRAPAPAPALPADLASNGLPRALPGGTLPVATEILRSTRTGVAAQGLDLAHVAVVSVPKGVSSLALAQAASAGAPDGAQLEVLNPIAEEPASPAGGAPLAAGASPLSRYLRDNNVSFIGSVLGPIGVGVFRSSLTTSPMVIALGQPLPNTPIILTSLKGQQAVLTQGTQSQTLVLDLRR